MSRLREASRIFEARKQAADPSAAAGDVVEADPRLMLSDLDLDWEDVTDRAYELSVSLCAQLANGEPDARLFAAAFIEGLALGVLSERLAHEPSTADQHNPTT